MSLAILLGIAGLILFVWVCLSVFRTPNRVVMRSVYCPVQERWVTAEFQEDPSDGKRVDVDWCTAFLPAAAIDCDKACLGFDELSPLIAPGSLEAAMRRGPRTSASAPRMSNPARGGGSCTIVESMQALH